mmetsp:Transcript_75254/g.200138  ORF Transcript_75254/g.200138 Transcript_75254/m.200138 type:complete len:241 (+) Transcript_75254:115-837(+)
MDGSARQRTEPLLPSTAAPPATPSDGAAAGVGGAAGAAAGGGAADSSASSPSSNVSCASPSSAPSAAALLAPPPAPSSASAGSSAARALLGKTRRRSIWARATGSTPDAFSCRNACSACTLAGLFVDAEKCSSSRSARSIVVGGYGRWVSGLTQRSATRETTSLKSEACCICRSCSDTWNSPLSTICTQISSSLSVPNAAMRSSLLARIPLSTLAKMVCACRTSSMSFSTLLRHAMTVFL